MTQFSLLVIEDDADMAQLLCELASSQGFQASYCLSIQEGFHAIKQSPPDVLFTDLRLPDGSGLQMVESVKAINQDTEVVMVTGYASLQDAIEGFKFGLFDLVTKPFETQLVKNLLTRLQELISQRLRMQQMQTRIEQLESKTQIPVARSAAMQQVLQQVEQVAPLDVSVLIYGETGVGKGVMARSIHTLGTNPTGPYFELNCAAVPENLVESELFGYEKGAFTGAATRKIGLLELANGGTLLLDEINSTRLDVQAKLLHFLQNQTLVRVGGNKTIKVNVRLLFATNQPLKSLVEQGLFREDLYYRINVFPIQLPPLRERLEDISALAEYFVSNYARRFNKRIYSISPKVIEALKNYLWPGNIRELENIIQRAVVLAGGDTIEISHLPSELHGSKIPGLQTSQAKLPEDATLAEVEMLWIKHALDACRGNKSLAAKKLGIDPSTLYRKLQKDA
ncbi:sigma-54-dependent Fis family transcriptional regulator [Thiomicrorhabdus sp. 6S2-11]|uniref:Sigma-54-dependent Fis family transcriptional regulator n=1 Tax=Thiomicrorhabdus marina TaxID=2818442 RepID=A0ABS3Q4J7_9GAMM|nr:sigma-54 dependent transcriptional regulator [Thiomicrorhabdus marina]MBO1927257.1 sigma-54-dependent Fis family transcriptional regulator [Thiomicrorhabdus marina]